MRGRVDDQIEAATELAAGSGRPCAETTLPTSRSTMPPVAQEGAPTWSLSPGNDAATSASANSKPSPTPSLPPPVPTSSSAPSSSSPLPPPPPPPSPTSPCAACKYQRRRCLPDCLLKPYFRADEPDKFKNALRMFGVRKLQHMVRSVRSERRDACARAIALESKLRAEDPVRGCCGVIQDLEEQLMDTAVELEVLLWRLDSYRHARGSLPQHPPNPHGTSAAADSSPATLQQFMGKSRGGGVQQQAPYGVPPAAYDYELAGIQQQLSAMEPQLPEGPQPHAPRGGHNSIQSVQLQPHVSEAQARSQRYNDDRTGGTASPNGVGLIGDVHPPIC